MNSQRGITLIELLTVTALLGILATLSISTFKLYQQRANDAVAETSLNYARKSIEASLNRTDDPPPAVALVSQDTPGPIINVSARSYLDGFFVSPGTEVAVEYNPGCIVGGCTADFLQVTHCNGTKSLRWMRSGDGVELLIEAAGGC